MPLDDAVQKVSIEGGDEVIASFKAMGDAGAQAFTQIVEAASRGDFTGIAAKITGDMGGAFAEITKNVFDFTESMSAAITKTAALSDAFGSTLAQTAGLEEAFASAGVGAGALDRLMQRMAMSVAQSWSGIQQSIREQSTASESALERLEAAHLGVQKAVDNLSNQSTHAAQQAVSDLHAIEHAQINLVEAGAKLAAGPGGKVDPGIQSALDAQKQLLAYKEAQEAVEKANLKAVEDAAKAEIARKEAVLQVQEARTKEAEAAQHVYDVELKNLDSIKEKITTLQAGGGAGNLAESSVQNIVRAFQSMASVGGKMAEPIDVLKEISKAFQAAGKEGLSFQEKIDIVTKLGGGAMARLGASASQMAEVLSRGPAALKAFEDEAARFGLVLGTQDVEAAKAAGAAFSLVETHLNVLRELFAKEMSPSIVYFLTNLDSVLKLVSLEFDNISGKVQLFKDFWNNLPLPVQTAIGGAIAGIPFGPGGIAVGAGGGFAVGAAAQAAEPALTADAAAKLKARDEAIKAGTGTPEQYASAQADAKAKAKAAAAAAAAAAQGGGTPTAPTTPTTSTITTPPTTGPTPAAAVTTPAPTTTGGGAAAALEKAASMQEQAASTQKISAASLDSATDKEKEVSTGQKEAAVSLDVAGGTIKDAAGAEKSAADGLTSAGGTIRDAAEAQKAAAIALNNAATALTQASEHLKSAPGSAPGAPAPGGTPSPRPSPYGGQAGHKDIVIGNNPGGVIDKAHDYWGGVYDRKDLVHFRGDCVSACVMSSALPYNQGCVEPTARFGIHMASVNGVPDQQVTDDMVKQYYPLSLQNYIKSHPLRPDVQYLDAKTITELGIFPPCPADSTKLALGKQPSFLAAGGCVGCDGGDCPGCSKRPGQHSDDYLRHWGDGIVRGPGSGTSDSILAALSNGEFVMKEAAVRTYGPGFMHAINNMEITPPNYAFGGMVGERASYLPTFKDGGRTSDSGSERMTTLNLHIGDEHFNGMKAPEHVADRLRTYAIRQQTTSTGRKPSWVN